MWFMPLSCHDIIGVGGNKSWVMVLVASFCLIIDLIVVVVVVVAVVVVVVVVVVCVICQYAGGC